MKKEPRFGGVIARAPAYHARLGSDAVVSLGEGGTPLIPAPTRSAVVGAAARLREI